MKKEHLFQPSQNFLQHIPPFSSRIFRLVIRGFRFNIVLNKPGTHPVREGVRFERGTVVTENVGRDERVEGVKVRFVPLWKWLLERGQKWTWM
jgi:hypothetical protein